MKRTIFLLALMLFSQTVHADESVWAKRKDDGPAVDRYFRDDDPYITQARVFMLGGGVQGFYKNYPIVFPSLDFEAAIWRYLTLGLFAGLYTTSDTLYSYSAYNGVFTVNVYPFGKFDMLFLRLGAGVFGTTVSTTTKVNSFNFTGVLMLGWRFLLYDPVSIYNVGFAIGGQYYSIQGQTVTNATALLEIALFL